MRNYLAGAESANILKEDTAERIAKIRKALGMADVRGTHRREQSEGVLAEEFRRGKRIEGIKHPKRWDANINGVEIVVNRVPFGNNDYEIYFPQLKTDYEKGIADQVIRISMLEEEAKKAFDKACDLASRLPDDKTDPSIRAAKIYKEIDRMRFKYDKDDESDEIKTGGESDIRLN